MRRLAITLAVLVGGVTAVPGQAFAHNPAPTCGPFTHGYEANFYVTEAEGRWWTAVCMNRRGYHGGFVRANVRRFYCGAGFCHAYMNARAADGSLHISYTRVDGWGRTYTTLWHQ